MNQYANSIMIFIFEKKLLLFITVIVELHLQSIKVFPDELFKLV